MQLDLDPQKLVFTDATGLRTKMVRLRGRAIRGECCRAGVLHGHSQTTRFAGALRLSGIAAPFGYDGSMNRNVFLSYVEEVLLPILQPGDILVIDNIPAHKASGVRDTMERMGAKLMFLPPDRPVFNAFENAFSKLETMSRAGAEKKIDALWDSVGTFMP
ncbi:transposase [Peteryoungia desertarenae]|uniref:Transposase n=1 Tax=Peteryoungia desertarenae TaxID=1813451 RepID=A0ABX6QLB8_9HYPH|nr:transposase [Peteryoungia desertarenae]